MLGCPLMAIAMVLGTVAHQEGVDLSDRRIEGCLGTPIVSDTEGLYAGWKGYVRLMAILDRA
ncbi:uncharacterized protein G2W53_007908 [Senna tora]|uniref:Uncharacterized protein n=1 Tax=Senna tora TaxID=362788 RepID=A0A835CE55_9FABA|nr:uncharacterized protein G2W53_007908 [Senna tora]